MKCTVVGYTRLTGKSKKTGKDYDFYSLGIIYKGERGYTGDRVKELSVDPEIVYGIEKLTCPIKADIDIGFGGRVTAVNFT